MKCFTILLTLFWTILIFAQSPIHVTNFNKNLAPICQNDETLFIDNHGEIIFSLPEGHREIRDFSELNVFNEGIATIETKEKKFYWINEKGERVKDFGKKYFNMLPFKNGNAIGLRKVRGVKMWFFLDKNGDELFGGKTFLSARHFSDGLARVKLDSYSENVVNVRSILQGEIAFIDKRGEIVLRFGPYNPKKIQGISIFNNGLVRVQTQTLENNYSLQSPRHIMNYQFINKKGEKVIDINELYPNIKIYSVGDFADEWLDIAYHRQKDNLLDVVFLDNNGKEMLKLERVKNYGTSWEGGLNYYVEGEKLPESQEYKYTAYWVDKDGNREEVRLNNKGKILKSIKKRRDYFEFQISHNGNDYCTGLYERNPLKEVFFTEDRLLDYDKTHALTVNEETNTHTLTRIPDGKILWQTRIEERFFNSLSEAMKYKERVTRFKMNDVDKIDKDFYKLKKLQFLSLNNVNIKALPKDLREFEELKNLKITNMKYLTYIPAWLSKLKKLEYLAIKDCGAYRGGLEYIIEHLPSLKKVELNNIKLSKAFKEKMKKLNPDLKI